MKAAAPEIPEWMKRALECPVCLEIIMDPPIYVCENPQGHSVCSTCHESLKKEGKTCPVCRKKMMNRRNVTLECMLDNNPSKVKCKFDGCDFKRSDGEAVKKHEDGCENRYVSCAFCEDKIGQKGLAEHVRARHHKTVLKCNNFGLSYRMGVQGGFVKSQAIFTVSSDANCHEFLCNWCLHDDVSMFWMAYIGPKDLASSYKYHLQVHRGKGKQ